MLFQFSLAAVLRMRESVEDREKLNLQRIQAEITKVSQYIDDLTACIAEARTAQELAMRQPTPAGHLQTFQWEAQATAEKRALLQKQLTSLEKKRVDQMKIYEAAHRDREALTAIYERQRRTWELDHARRDQKQLDDLTIMRRCRAVEEVRDPPTV